MLCIPVYELLCVWLSHCDIYLIEILVFVSMSSSLGSFGSLAVYLQNKIHLKEINLIPEEESWEKHTMVCELRRVKLKS